MKLDKKRRIEGKTDYSARMKMLKSGMPRIVVRKTNKYIYIQYVKSFEAKDKVILGINSYDLLNLGWPKEAAGSLKSVPASYLTGYLAGKKIIEKEKSSKMIVDLGIYRNVHESRLYAAVKGLIDAGLKLSADEKVFPSKEKISGKYSTKTVQQNFEKVKGSIK